MSIFKLSKQTLIEIESIIRKFLRGRGDKEKKIQWVGWNKLTRMKKLGGLGLRDLTIFNQAMLAKLAWRSITESNKLWVKVLTSLCCPSNKLLANFNSKEGSWVWQSIQYGLERLRSGLRW